MGAVVDLGERYCISKRQLCNAMYKAANTAVLVDEDMLGARIAKELVWWAVDFKGGSHKKKGVRMLGNFRLAQNSQTGLRDLFRENGKAPVPTLP